MSQLTFNLLDLLLFLLELLFEVGFLGSIDAIGSFTSLTPTLNLLGKKSLLSEVFSKFALVERGMLDMERFCVMISAF